MIPAYLILMLTDRCNLSCQYCYLGQNKKSVHNGKEISSHLIDKALSLWFANKNRWRIQITGGEPFLARELLEYTAKKIRDVSFKSPVSVQTNATLLNHRDADLIKRYHLEIGVSLDGDPDIQNRVRGKAADTFRGIRCLEEAKIPFNVTCVVSSANADRLHRLVLALGGFSMARGIGFDLLVCKGRAMTSGISPASPQALTTGIRKLKQALTMVNAGRSTPLVLRELEKIKSARRGIRPSAFCHAASGKSLLVSPGGELYPCSQTAFDPAFYLGTLENKQTQSKAAAGSGKRPQWPTLEERAKNLCPSCSLNACCPGECPSRLYYGNTGETPLACTLYQALADNESNRTRTRAAARQYRKEPI